MPARRIIAAGIGGIRTAVDLLAWMQMTRRMKLADAKSYVVDKLSISPVNLVDGNVMITSRQDLGIGDLTPEAGGPEGILAKCKVSELQDIETNSVQIVKVLSFLNSCLFLSQSASSMI
jgi:dimethylamine--corrinoid protein Co-methyltransferase